MLHKEIIGLLLLLFLGWTFVSSSGTERIQRFCAPVSWVGNVAVSAAALASPDSQKALGKTMNKVTYGCEYMVWRLFYQSTYNEYMATKGDAVPAPEVRDTPVEDPVSDAAVEAKPAPKKAAVTPKEAPLPAEAPVEPVKKQSPPQKTVKVIE